MIEKIVPQKKAELLAPAGSLEAFFAAMEKGADAVYAGLKEFSARAKAKNFTLQQMERMTAYAHSQEKKVYVTLNTLVKESELPQLVDTLSSLEAMGVDAVIIQDMAVARLVRRFFPAIPLHASTQMTVHNSPGVQQLADLGFERVVLSRELHLDEISRIVRKSPIGIECFIHGALCFSLSGQCYFSSFLGGHSGNRGRCAQPCRRQYKYRGKEGYYFSTNDFSSIDLIPQMVAAGVESFKIEGRMKSAEYVAAIVGAYRKVLDAAPDSIPAAIGEARELIKLSFGRVPTKGFLASHSPADIATPSLRGATGRFLGEIKAIRGGRIHFESRDRLHVGDRIRIQPKSDMAGKAFTVREIFIENRQVKSAAEKSRVAITSPFPAVAGDAVFKVSSETAFTMSENACSKRLDSVTPGRIVCNLNFSLHDKELMIGCRAAGKTTSISFQLPGLEPSHTSDMAAVLRGQFAKSGETRFVLGTLAADGFPPVLIPPVLLKEIRREFYLKLAEWLLPLLERDRRELRELARASISPRRGLRPGKRPELTVRIERAVDLHLLQRDGVDSAALPVSRANMHQIHQICRRLRGREDSLTWRIPFIIFEEDLPWYREALAYLRGAGFRCFEAANISHFPLLRELDNGTSPQLEISCDYRLFSLNSQALQAWHDLGVTAAALYIEDDADNLSSLLSADLPLQRRVLLYGEVPAITSKIVIKGVKSDAPLLSDRGEGYRVTVHDGLTQITPLKKFSLTQFREKLHSMGCSHFIIDLSHTDKGEQEQVLSAYAAGRELPETSPFNFLQGLV
ncbi:MAG TPA: U32 family peptidase [Geobacteraceae bacterium]|nr:U32 family peptidase [Geobacteraceae bacterium]